MSKKRVGVAVLWMCMGVAFACGGASEPVVRQGEEKPTETANGVADQALRDAALEGRMDSMKAAVGDGAQIDGKDADGRTALMYAAFNGHTACGRWLLEQGAAVGERESLGRTALMFASTGPFSETVQLLLEAGSNPHDADQHEGWTALMFAAGEGQLEVVQVLLDHGANPSDKDFDGDQAADHAARNKHPEVEALLRNLKPE